MNTAASHVDYRCTTIEATLVQDMGNTLAHQAQLFYQHDIIFLPHGATTVNAIFSRPGTVLVEAWPICKQRDNYRGANSWLELGSSPQVSVQQGKMIRFAALYSCGGKPNQMCEPAMTSVGVVVDDDDTSTVKSMLLCLALLISMRALLHLFYAHIVRTLHR